MEGRTTYEGEKAHNEGEIGPEIAGTVSKQEEMPVRAQGERWFPDTRPFSAVMKDSWFDCYCDSEIGKLRAVLLRRPGREIDLMDDPGKVRFLGRMDGGRARVQQDTLADIYRQHGVDVYYVEQAREDRPNSLYMRDMVLMTPEGAIIGRAAMEARRGEERFAAKALADLGVPIIKTVNAGGIFECACALWVNRRTVIIGTGARANKAGAEQVKSELRNIGVENFIEFQIPYGHAHVDGLLNIADRRTAFVFPWQVPYDVCAALMDLGFTIVEAQDITEAKVNFGVNFVALEPGLVVMPQGNPGCKAALEDAGVEVIDADISEIRKGWGGIHCMTAFIKRDPIGE